MMGVLGVRGSEAECGGDGGMNGGTGLSVTGDEVGNGTAFVSEDEERFGMSM